MDVGAAVAAAVVVAAAVEVAAVVAAIVKTVAVEMRSYLAVISQSLFQCLPTCHTNTSSHIQNLSFKA